MRVAILSSSSYARSGKLPELPHAEEDTDALVRRLSEADAGFSVHVLPAERGLPDEMERLLDGVGEPIDALLVHFSGYATVSEEGFPALVLDGERLSSLSLRRLQRVVTGRAKSAFLVLDTTTAFADAGVPSDMVRLYNGVIAGRDVGVHLLAAHGGGDVPGPSPFANLLALTLDWHASADGLSPEGLYVSMRREEALFRQIPSVAYYAATSPFDVLLPAGARATSLPAPALAPEAAEERADAALAAGDVEGALGELTLALEQLGPPPTPRHPPLYQKIALALRRAERLEDAFAYYEAALAIDESFVPALQGEAELAIATGDRKLALARLARFILVDPNALSALEQSARLLGESGSWDELATLYEATLPRVSEPAIAAELALKMDALCRDVLARPDRAVSALERAAELAPSDLRLRRRLAELLSARGAALGALPHLVAVIRRDPRAADLREAARLFDRAGRPDATWNAACALEVLGDADVNESLLAAAHRPDGLLAAREMLSEDHWKKRLLCLERDPAIDELFAAMGAAVVDVGLETAQRKRRLVLLDASTAMDPDKSTATLIKMAGWSARLLGMTTPKVHLLDGLRSPFFAPPAAEPTLAVSKTLGRGLEMPALAFLWSRQLAFLRPEHRPIVFFPSAAELGALVLSALSFGGLAQLPLKKLEDDAKLFARGMRRTFPGGPPPELAAVVARFPVRDATARIIAWARAVELGAARAGLLACGDLELAASLVREFPASALVEPDDVVKDLVGYCVSDEYAVLRDRLGVLVRAK